MFNLNFTTMKNLLILCLTFLFINSYAQDGGKYDGTLRGQALRGFLIDDNGDTVRGSIKIDFQYSMQRNPWITPDDIKLKNRNYVAESVKYYEIENNTKWFSTKFTILKAPSEGKMSFSKLLHVFEFGPITLFDYNFYDDKVNPPINEVKTYMQLPNGDVVDMASMLFGFKNKMSEYVKDYPELAAKIANKEKGYGILGIYDIVREYNKWYMAKNPNFTIMKK